MNRFHLKRISRMFLKQYYSFSFSTTSHKPNKHLEYCQKLVKSRDYDNYLATALLQGLSQHVGFTVRAFNIEIAQIQESTSTQETAKMRIEFWRHNIKSTFQGQPPNHPVTILLALCLEKQWLSEKWFQRVVDVRERYLNNAAFMSLDDKEDYGEYAVSSLYYLILESLQVTNNDIYYAASHLGIANSLITLIKASPYYIKQGSVILPTELCVKHDISQEDILRGQKQEQLSEIMFDLASQASLHIDGMKNYMKDTVASKEIKNVFLPHITCEQFLNHLQKTNFDINNPAFNRKHWSLPWKLYFASKRKLI
ncbi:NADH dehydrogenase (ubiquinone) complex I, assembly factor 6-like [Clytia hemisphaerica]|uniref:NADH dehydrogenase (ubiquinone) complex I, assembly factor 6-like n=1 Tax=Clytia hemisphaerica TaxID=252671 RepID=UPI0034D5EEB2